ncbi:hypothetical protein ACTA71_012378 [Dictyostelium dimigraforme]
MESIGFKVAEVKDKLVIVDYNVKMSYIENVPRSKSGGTNGSIGTDGCQVCLGVLAVYDDRVYVAHSCCEMNYILFKGKPFDDPEIQKYVKKAQIMFYENFPKDKTPESITCVAYEPTDLSTRVLLDGLKLVFGPLVKEIEKGYDIIWTGTGVTKLKTNFNLQGRAPEKEAEKGPMMVKE